MSLVNEGRPTLHLISTIRLIFAGLVFVGLGWAGIAIVKRLQEPSKRIRAMANAKQIHLALSEYAIDYDGIFPIADEDSNSAYRQLFSESFSDERIFYVFGSAWHDSLPSGANGPDGKIGSPPEYFNALEKGENHWAYVEGANNGSKGNQPLVVDGFSETAGVFSLNPLEKGGALHDGNALVIRVDGSAMLRRVSKDGRVYLKRNGQKIDAFSLEAGIDPQNLKNPL